MTQYLLADLAHTDTSVEVPFVLGLVSVITLALIHIYIGQFRWLDQIFPKFRWLSLGAGVSMTYVFLQILPELSLAQSELEHIEYPWLEYLDRHVYLIALVGLATFYGFEVLVQHSRRANLKQQGLDQASHHVFWIHIGAFSLYNFLIGEFLVDFVAVSPPLALLRWLAFALHFLVNDHALREHHKHTYDHRGRWIIANALVIGWLVGRFSELPEGLAIVLGAFVAGGTILNVLKEELPDNRDSCFWTFSVGSAVYTALLLIAT